MSRLKSIGTAFLFPDGYVRNFPEGVCPRGLKMGGERPIFSISQEKVTKAMVFCLHPLKGYTATVRSLL